MLDKIENALMILATSIGIMEIESILGVILLSFQVLLLIIKYGAKVYQAIKKFIVKIKDLFTKKKYDKIDEAIEDLTEELESTTQDTIEDFEKLKGGK